MEFLNKSENRDVKKVINNYVNNVNLKFETYDHPWIKGCISMIYYISPNSKISQSINVYDSGVMDYSESDIDKFFRIYLFDHQNKNHVYEYELLLYLNNDYFKLTIYPLDSEEGEMDTCWQIDYKSNKDEVDKLLDFFSRKRINEIDA